MGGAMWAGARKNAEAFDNRNPGWQEQARRHEDNVPDPGYDDLKAAFPVQSPAAR